jgi:hypothetical protein
VTTNAATKQLLVNLARSLRAEFEAEEQGREFTRIGWPIVIGTKVLKGEVEGVHWMQATPWGQRCADSSCCASSSASACTSFRPRSQSTGRQRNKLAIGVFSLFLGWTFLGWVAALI